MVKIKLDTIIKGVFLALAAFLTYHIILKLLGGSLGKDDIMLSILVVIFTLTANNSISIARIEGKFDQFEKSFRALAVDFKALVAEVRHKAVMKRD